MALDAITQSSELLDNANEQRKRLWRSAAVVGGTVVAGSILDALKQRRNYPLKYIQVKQNEKTSTAYTFKNTFV